MLISLAVVRWLSSSKPWTFTKLVFLHPSSLAFSFIILIKFSVLPPICSAIATAASFALAIAILFKSSFTLNWLPASKNTWLPPIDAALLLIFTFSSKLIFPDSRASIISNIVITLVIDAGCSFSSAFVSFNTLPVDASIKMLDLALSSRSSALTISGIIIRQINRNNFFT